MKPDAPEPSSAPLNLLRQQLLLAQVRIMELEDARDELAPRVAETAKLLAEAQALADRKTEEAAHLESVRAGLQEQYEHMRHMQHVTQSALEETRAALTGVTQREASLLAEAEQLQGLISQQAGLARGYLARIDELSARAENAERESATRLGRITELDAEQRAMKTSRSWRWTAWLRSLERSFGGKP